MLESQTVKDKVAALSLHWPALHVVDDGSKDVKDVLSVEGVCDVWSVLGGVIVDGIDGLLAVVGGAGDAVDGNDGEGGLENVVPLDSEKLDGIEDGGTSVVGLELNG